ncbi:MAG: GHKL domain-containing protein [Proteobacteria bacterium]|nr:MAG: GHKL domain-containing protein [Pseudomonadota bacterium]
MAYRRFSSLRARLLAVASLVMLMFTAVTVGVLDNAFERAAQNSVREQLSAQLYALLTAAELDLAGAIYFPERLAEPRFSVAASGLYAFVYDVDGTLVWRSASALTAAAPRAATLPVGTNSFALESDARQTPLFVLRFGVAWEADGGVEAFTFVVAEDLARYHAQVGAFRRNLYFWGVLGIAFLLALQLSILHWAMRPLRAVAREIGKVEAGRQRLIEGVYPSEIAGLTRNINRLIDSSQQALDRYRNSLGDLAHSLKTPLAVLRGLCDEDTGADAVKITLREQTRRMGDIVDHQLKRASSSGGASGGWSVVREVVDRLVSTLRKVYADRGLSFTVDVAADIRVPMDSADLMEILGNVMDNACKWGRERVEVRAETETGQIVIQVIDDGPGVGPDRVREVLRRGVRADEQMAGQGIGLAVVRDVLESYHGSVDIDSAPSGGARVLLRIPSPSGVDG